MRLGALLEEARDASDEIRYLSKREGDANVLTTLGLNQRIRRLLRALTRVASVDERATEIAIANDLDKDWGRTTERGRDTAIATAQGRVRKLGDTVSGKTQPVFETYGREVFGETRAASRRRFRLPIAMELSDRDEIMLRFVKESQTNFITDEYRRRSISLSKRARRIVEAGMREGLSRDQLTRLLAKDVQLLLTGRSKHYFDVVSRIFVNRGRTLSSLLSYDEGGVKRYEFVAVLDSRTSDICRFMHGKTWDVGPELDRFEEATRLRDPEKIRDLSPFVQRGKDAEGKNILYIKQGGRKRRVATIEESGLGQKGERGRYSKPMTNAQLRAAGVTVPPLHGA